MFSQTFGQFDVVPSVERKYLQKFSIWAILSGSISPFTFQGGPVMSVADDTSLLEGHRTL